MPFRPARLWHPPSRHAPSPPPGGAQRRLARATAVLDSHPHAALISTAAVTRPLVILLAFALLCLMGLGAMAEPALTPTGHPALSKLITVAAMDMAQSSAPQAQSPATTPTVPPSPAPAIAPLPQPAPVPAPPGSGADVPKEKAAAEPSSDTALVRTCKTRALAVLRQRSPSIEDIFIDVDGLTVAEADSTVGNEKVRHVLMGEAYIQRDKTDKVHRFLCLTGDEGKVLMTFFTER
ncbi:hypothetical protein [Roseixanthobacter pseudopolyaromaticivorans]|uniref:hypothetical protein n=1 Tax=Xanthobacteraceae TaxID=335928 RepID=UPI00372884A1